MSFDRLEYFKDNVDKARQSAGGNWTGTCPSCQKGPAKFYCQLDPEHEKYGSFICYSCDFRSRNFATLIQLIEDCSLSAARDIMREREVVFKRREETPESLKLKIMGFRKPEEELTADIWEEKTGVELPPEFKSVYLERKKKWRVPEYMTNRGFKRDTLRKWGIGYCETGKYQGRVIIPLECPNGSSFTARDITGEQDPKYLNPPGVDHSLLLFGWKFVKPGADFALVEGPTDAMKMEQWGIPALAFGGKSLSTAQLNLLFTFPSTASVTIMLDPDAIADAYRVANMVKIKFDNVFVAKIPLDKKGKKQDPGSSTKEQAWEWYENAPLWKGDKSLRSSALILESLEKFKKRFL